MVIEGDVLTLKCTACTAVSHSFQFYGDTDMLIGDLAAARSCSGDKVVLGAMLPEELQDDATGLERFAQRMSRELQNDFRAMRITRYAGGNLPLEGTTFQEFRRVYEPPQPVFACLNCAGDALVIARESPTDFKNGGGSLVLVGDLMLA